MAEQPLSPAPKKPINWILTLVLCAVIGAIALGVVLLIQSTEPKPQRTGASKRSAMLVETAVAERGTYQPQIVAMGVVRAREDVMLSPRVSGEIIERAPNFNPGAHVKQGEVLLRIDPSDYQNAVAQARSALHQAEADLQIEMGRQTVAKLDYELLDSEIAAGSESLILREPQLNAAKSDVEAAQARLDQALLNLERTTIRAPFDAQVLTREVAVGSQVSPGDSLGHLTGVENYWVTTTVPLRQLQYINFADQDDRGGSTATIRNRTAWAPGASRKGYVSKLIGSLDEGTRLARINVVAPDPLATQAENEGQPPLIIGSLLEVTITGAPIENIIRIHRDHLRENDTVWIKDQGKLRIQPVVVLFQDAEYAYISSGLEDDETIVTSGLSSVVNGAPLRVQGEPAEAADS